VWAPNDELFFDDFNGPNMLSLAREHLSRSIYAVAPLSQQPVPKLIGPDQIIISESDDNRSMILRETAPSLASDQAISVSNTGALRSVGSITRGDKHVWSQDKTRLAQLIDGSDPAGFIVEVVELDRDPHVVTQYAITGPVWGLAWDGRGRRILFGSSNTVQSLDTVYGTRVLLLELQDSLRVQLLGRLAQ